MGFFTYLGWGFCTCLEMGGVRLWFNMVQEILAISILALRQGGLDMSCLAISS